MQPEPASPHSPPLWLRRLLAVAMVGLAGCAATSLTLTAHQPAVGAAVGGGPEALLRVPGGLPTPVVSATPDATPPPTAAMPPPVATLPATPYYTTTNARPTNAPAPYRAPVHTASPPPPGPDYRLWAPQIKQDHPLDCESAALASALQYVGIDWTQDQVLASLPVDNRPVVASNGWPVQWGNPYEDFVGNVDGSEENLTGYGVYDTAIAAVAEQAGAAVTVQSGWTLAQLVAELAAGNPVVVWVPWHLYPAYVTSYTSWDGQNIWFSKSEHAQVLVGYNSNSGNVTLMDPWEGMNEVYPASTFMQRFNAFDAQAVAISLAPPTPTPSPTPTTSPSPSVSASPTATSTAGPSATPSPTATASPSPSSTASESPSETASPRTSSTASPAPDSS